MKFEVGSAYLICFKDHCLGEDHILMDCSVLGWVLSQDEDRVTVTFWKVDKDEYKEGNDEPCNIIKSTITKKRKLQI